MKILLDIAILIGLNLFLFGYVQRKWCFNRGSTQPDYHLEAINKESEILKEHDCCL